MASSTMQHPFQPPSNTPLTSSTHQTQNPAFSNLPPQLNNTNNSNFNPKKRPLDHIYLLQSSPYFKIRAILKELRPLFLEVLRAPNFQTCEAATKIQEKMKLMVDICRVHVEPSSYKHDGSQKFTDPRLPIEKQGGSHKFTDQRPQEKRFSYGNNSETAAQGSHRIPGTYIVGGSAFGWNFITFHGTKPVYYGRTKEAFRAGK